MNARRVRQSLERAFKKLGYSGSVFITGFGDQKQTSAHLLQGLSSTGVNVAHTVSESTCSQMFTDMLIWRDHNSCSTTMMLISNQVDLWICPGYNNSPNTTSLWLIHSVLFLSQIHP
ncbi:hypothetical protein CARUB_v10021170mg [Capsella rubella]|uniref:NYN domain-containing protein n=1 Tax=Capsella rubella TaxID=81985 RepID=R0GJ53_9BRAS|nr:hypothetical protein CARUB_v10021170mg [Capsella rubella]